MDVGQKLPQNYPDVWRKNEETPAKHLSSQINMVQPFFENSFLRPVPARVSMLSDAIPP